MQYNPIQERDDWFITDRKPTICPMCGKKEVRKAILSNPSPEDFNNKNIYLIDCIPAMPIDRTWGCRNCNAGFWKDTPRNIVALGWLFPHQWPPKKGLNMKNKLLD